MGSLERVTEGMRLFREGRMKELDDYLAVLGKEDPLAHSFMKSWVAGTTSRPAEAIREGTRLLPKLTDEPILLEIMFTNLAIAYRQMGDLSVAENYFLRVWELKERRGDKEGVARTKLNLFHLKMARAEYESLRHEIDSFLKEVVSSYRPVALHIRATLDLILGRPERAWRTIQGLCEKEVESRDRMMFLGIKEIAGIIARVTGRLEKSMELYMGAAEGFVKLGSPYAAFPCAKALHLSRVAGLLPPPDRLIRDCLRFSRRGSLGDIAAAQEISAFLAKEDSGAVTLLFEAARGYSNGYHPIEAFLAGAQALAWAWELSHPLFFEAARFLAPMIPLYQGFKEDPFIGPFLRRIEPLLLPEYGSECRRGIRARLIGGLRVTVDGKELNLLEWQNKKAFRLLIYLLMAPKHRIPVEHLCYLLWPKERGGRDIRKRLYTAVSFLRGKLGKPEYLVKRYGNYQLENVTTDLEELEGLVIRAEATSPYEKREEILSSARALASGELLPEITDDEYVDEYRIYYKGLKKRVFKDQ
jgi:hypothetical protein